MMKYNVEMQKYEKREREREGNRIEMFVCPETRITNRLYVDHVW